VSSRLAEGGAINRQQTFRFSFDGKNYSGCAGDSLASALLANDVRLVGRSFKYHRPRGILSAGTEEPNALVELRTGARREPNTRATAIELYDEKNDPVETVNLATNPEHKSTIEALADDLATITEHPELVRFVADGGDHPVTTPDWWAASRAGDAA